LSEFENGSLLLLLILSSTAAATATITTTTIITLLLSGLSLYACSFHIIRVRLKTLCSHLIPEKPKLKMPVAFGVVLVLALVFGPVQGKFFLLEGEHCDVLSNSTTMFDRLLPCGDYHVEPIDLHCLDDSQIAIALKSLPN
jgi:hypothetical protein